MAGIDNLNTLIAFGGGLASFFSPCVLPLIPAYLAALGTVANPEPTGSKGPAGSFWPSLAFVTGFSAVFILMGLSLGVAGSFLLQHRLTISRFGGILLIIFGISQLGFFNLSFFQRSWVPPLKPTVTGGTGRLFLMGVIFSLGWSPCIGPILAGILFLAVGAGNYQQAMLYMLAYSAGLALPFLAISLFVDGLLMRLRSSRGFWPWLGRINATLLIVLGIILIIGKY